jgi:uncharacterized NAD(P)/FAD-binding protein YdhS
VTVRTVVAAARTVAVVGGGLSGSLFALKLSRARPDFRVVLIERGQRLGRGVAYGACSPRHLLNVPVSRMEVGLTPGFGEWLGQDPEAISVMAPALRESGGDLRAAFAPRFLFGRYLQARVTEALTTGPGSGLAAARGEAVGLDVGAGLRLRLADGRDVEADIVVLATGNMPPRAPGGPGRWLHDSPHVITDPWQADAYIDVRPGDSILMLGTGLTTVDIALKLSAGGHHGPMLALSRRGLAPRSHADGGAWPPFLEEALPAPPLQLMRRLREQVAAAEARGVAWQRVFDAARPAIPAVWRGWDTKQRRQFLRHARPHWDVRRHRMAPRVAEAFDALIRGGQLVVKGGRILGYEPNPAPDGGRIAVAYAPRGGGEERFLADWVINCTGPRRDLDRCGIPLLAGLREAGLATPDALGLGLETDDCALIDRARRPSDRLFALGALTCPSWWEIVAVPEISLQVERLVARLSDAIDPGPRDHPLAAEDFLDLGAGI